jgi:hypothetical protein
LLIPWAGQWRGSRRPDGQQITRDLEINGLRTISREAVETARKSVVIERSDHDR